MDAGKFVPLQIPKVNIQISVSLDDHSTKPKQEQPFLTGSGILPPRDSKTSLSLCAGTIR